MILRRSKHPELSLCVKVDAIDRSKSCTLLGTNDRRGCSLPLPIKPKVLGHMSALRELKIPAQSLAE
jgi:hypothetical protein